MITTTDAWLSILHLSLLFCRCLLECCHFWKGLWIVIQWKELPPLNFLIILSFVAQQTLHLLLTWWKVSDIVFASQEELNRKYKDFSPSKANFSSECWSLWFFHNVTCLPSSLGNKSYRLWFAIAKQLVFHSCTFLWWLLLDVQNVVFNQIQVC